MADPGQLELLKRGVSEWNVWRREHPGIQPDLIHANLSGADLSSANLRGAFFSNANLSSANLSRTFLSNANLSRVDLSSADLKGVFLSDADLYRADLINADLSHASLIGAHLSHAKFCSANLSDAKLSGANLSGADLSGADLSGANLSGAYLSGAYLSGADLSGASLNHTNIVHTRLDNAKFHQAVFSQTLFAWVDLSNIKELATARHDGPSIVHINSVTLPRDEPTRLHFLRGVGFTETQIEYLPSLLTPCPIEYSSLFISYAHQDQILAKRLYTDLRKKDVPCWFAPHDLRPGTPILRGIEEAIHVQEKFLLILSKHAVKSEWIKQEVDAALYQEIKRRQDVLFPIRLDNAILKSHAGWATQLQRRHIGDFTNFQDEGTYQEAFSTLLRHLKIAQPPVR